MLAFMVISHLAITTQFDKPKVLRSDDAKEFALNPFCKNMLVYINIHVLINLGKT